MCIVRSEKTYVEAPLVDMRKLVDVRKTETALKRQYLLERNHLHAPIRQTKKKCVIENDT